MRSLILASTLFISATISHGADTPVEFNRDIRPILAENCFQCHGPDANQRKADLRLDLADVVLGDDGPVAAGKPDDSELLSRVTSTDDEQRMPPVESGKRLSDGQIQRLRQWIDQGADWEEHWSLTPPVKPAIPAVKNPRVKNDVDRFLLEKLQRESLTFSPPADRRTLIRRLYFDLVGLPPQVEEVDAFVTSQDPRAYEILVDKLLRSPQYGERMALYWLDLVRYADTNGIHGDNHREHWLYRDYVIQAFNSNMPFDQFTIEQLGGDLLKQATSWQRIASGYNRLNMTTREGGAQAKEYLAKYSADRVRNASTVWMGATLGCAECHDHKFDPYSTRDFYQFAAFFADVQETAVGAQRATKIPTDEQQRALKTLDEQIDSLQKQLDAPTALLLDSLTKWEKQRQAEGAEDWTALTPIGVEAAQGSELTIGDNGVINVDQVKDRDHFVLRFKGPFEGLTALQLEVLTVDAAPAKGPGLADNGNFVLSEVRIKADGTATKLGTVTATHSQGNYSAVSTADGKPGTGWAVLPQTGKPHELVLPFEQPVACQELEVVLEFNYGSKHVLGRFRLHRTTAEPAPTAGHRSVPDKVRQLLQIESSQRNKKEQQELLQWYRTIAPELKGVRDQLASAPQQRKTSVDTAPMVLVATAGAPRETRVLPRGNWLDESGPVVEPRTPSFLQPLESEGRASRLDLAHWLVDPKNPFVARVMVNRLWKLAFGHGIVRTLDDLGAQGRTPSHPELLDYLAVEFRETGWDIKHIIRLLVTSSAYQQSSAESTAVRERDPLNELFARQSRFRLDAEVIRDNVLAVSGLLVQKQGGPSVKPYQPAGYWSHLNFPRRTYQHDSGESQYRRGLYTYWCRTFLHPSLLAFDATTREECTVERARSNTPLAALVLLNDPTYVEAARVLAERAMRIDSSPSKRLRWLFRQVLGRTPNTREQQVLIPLVAEHVKQYEADPEAAMQLIQVGLQPRNEKLGPAQLAAWTTATRILLNLHETITRN